MLPLLYNACARHRCPQVLIVWESVSRSASKIFLVSWWELASVVAATAALHCLYLAVNYCLCQ
jgi:hypothetical protein